MTHSPLDGRTEVPTGAQGPPAIRLFGGAAIHINGVPAGGAAAHRHRLALLTVLATSRRPVSRDKLVALLWPERDATSARNLLKVAVHALRKVLGESALRTIGDQMALDEQAVACDVTQFEAALTEGALEAAVGLYAGQLLDGFHLKGAPEFERLVESERARLAHAFGGTLERLAAAADARRDFACAATWWRALANHAPERADVAMRLMRALAATGDVPGALRHAEIHAKLRRQALELEPEPAVERLANELRSARTQQLSAAQSRLAVAPESKPLTKPEASSAEPHFSETKAARAPATPNATQRRVRVTMAIGALVGLAAIGAGIFVLRGGTATAASPPALTAAPAEAAPDTGGGAIVFDGRRGLASTPPGAAVTLKTDDIAFDLMVRYDGYIPGTADGLLYYNGLPSLSGWGVLVLPPHGQVREGTLALLAGGVTVLPTPVVLKRGVWHHLTVQRRATRVTFTLDDLSFDAGVVFVNPMGASQGATERTLLGGAPQTAVAASQVFHGAVARVRIKDLSNNYWIERWNFGEGSGTATMGYRGSVLSLINVGWSGSR
jgi:DNA-binding SARP family transcriptional activator